MHIDMQRYIFVQRTCRVFASSGLRAESGEMVRQRERQAATLGHRRSVVHHVA